MSYIAPMWEEFYKQLENINPERFWEHPVIKQTITSVGSVYQDEMLSERYIARGIDLVAKVQFNSTLWNNIGSSLWRYLYYAMRIEDIFGRCTNKKILEIGAGYGGLCRVLTKLYDVKSYTVVDHKAMLRIFTSFNKRRFAEGIIKTYDIDDINCVRGRDSDAKYDIFISTICLSETSRTFIDYIVKHVFPLCRDFFIICANTPDNLVRELSRSIEDLGKNVSVTKYINYKDVFVINNYSL